MAKKKAIKNVVCLHILADGRCNNLTGFGAFAIAGLLGMTFI
jgi:hypothetical protein